MGLNKPISVSGGLTAAEVQTIIDAQTTAITGKVDEQTNTLKTDIPSSISGGATISDINAALDEKLPQYQNGAVVKSVQRGVGNATSIAINNVNPDKCIVLIDGIVEANMEMYSGVPWGNAYGGSTLESLTSDIIAMSNVKNTYSWQLVEFY